MKKILLAEEVAQLAIAILALSLQPIQFNWLLWPLFFLLPDISMLGYLVNPKTGAFSYNLLHHKGIALVILVLGYFIHNDALLLAGLLLLAHSCFDRVMGYGLKYSDSFHNTHLGRIDKTR